MVTGILSVLFIREIFRMLQFYKWECQYTLSPWSSEEYDAFKQITRRGISLWSTHHTPGTGALLSPVQHGTCTNFCMPANTAGIKNSSTITTKAKLDNQRNSEMPINSSSWWCLWFPALWPVTTIQVTLTEPSWLWGWYFACGLQHSTWIVSWCPKSRQRKDHGSKHTRD